MNRIQLLNRMRIPNLTQLNSIINLIKPTSDLLLSPSSSLSLSFSRLFFFSSHTSNSSSQPNSSNLQTSISDTSSSLGDAPIDDITTQGYVSIGVTRRKKQSLQEIELKRAIEIALFDTKFAELRYLGGDMEALPSIFEAILARKLSGKHDETDDELMEEFRSKTEQVGDQKFQSDEDSDEDLTDSDEELSD